ncbi:hypothetical protein FNH22_30695 [Fulvivirga sp. M361]|uniref:FG-GAP repeat domain-containing protein n=1 Tax=Fulvivirga sp. M361 TaxID=2594266 RepID=UPI00117AE48F|nr:VCBS repeat-containing protein [Fulvivirga sp. M361]TRX46479.1 hypothetical protein FNH22_30695 [Fulvivirga sp. M361]
MKSYSILIIVIILFSCEEITTIKKVSGGKTSTLTDGIYSINERFIDLDTIYISTNDDLKEIIESVPDNTCIIITSGTYNLENTIYLTEKSNIVISGEGLNSTIINIVPKNEFRRSITIGKNIKSLLIQNLSFVGIGSSSNIYHAAIGSSLGGATTGVENISIKSIKVDNLPVGISIGGGSLGSYNNVLIKENIVKNTVGNGPGFGYGIHNESATNVLIESNRIEHATRHSIYQARNEEELLNPGFYSVIIKNNQIVNHNYPDNLDPTNRAAILVARSSNILVTSNEITSSASVGIRIFKSTNVNEPYPVGNITVSFNNLTNMYNHGISIDTNNPFLGLIQKKGVVGFDLSDVRDRIIKLDYNGDSFDDILLYRPGTGIVNLGKSGGNLSFTDSTFSSTGMASFDLRNSMDQIISLDYDGDNDDDIMCYRPGSGIVYMARSNGDGTFTNVMASESGVANFDLRNSMDQIISLDYDGDNDDDIMCYRPGFGTVYIGRSNGDSTFTNIVADGLGIIGFDLMNENDRIVSLDYNGDERDDIFCYRPGSGIFYMGRSNGDGTFTNVVSNGDGIANFDLRNENDRIISLDYNGDRLDDIICYRPGERIISLGKSNRDRTFSTVYKSITGTASFDLTSMNDLIIALNLNHDNSEDIILYRPGSGDFYAGMSNGELYRPLLDGNHIETNCTSCSDVYEENIVVY